MEQENRHPTELKEQPTPATIRLEFFRHDEKAKPEEGQPDTTVRLTGKGRKHSSKSGKGKSPKAEMAVAYGSPRERSIETSMRHILAEEEVGEDASLEDMRELVSGRVKMGKKDVVSDKLNFVWDGTEEFKDIANDYYANKKDALRFMVEESDQLAKQLGDKTSTSYSRQAGNIAQLIKRYLEILPNWQQVAGQNPEKYGKDNRELQRFLGSHQTVTESFLMKVIEKTKGKEEVLRFIASLPDKNGFGFSEGYTVGLESTDNQTRVIVRYKNMTWNIKPEIVDDIINDQRFLDKSIK